MKSITQNVLAIVLCIVLVVVVVPCMDESESERWAESSLIERLPVVIFAIIVGVAAAVLRFMFRVDSFTRTMIVMVLCAGMIMLGMIGLTYTAMRDRPVTQMGAEVQTTEEYGHLFNDSFAGRVVRGVGVWERAVTVRNPEGVERRIAIKWLEAGGGDLT